MKKKIFIAIFFIMICLPSLGMFFYKTDISAEKRGSRPRQSARAAAPSDQSRNPSGSQNLS